MLSLAARRRGFTLPEMLFVLVIFGLVAGALMRIILRQQRFYASTTDLIAMRTTLRDIGEALPSDLRGISSVGGDIYAMSDSAIDFRLSTGISVICSIGVARLTAVIPPTNLSNKSALTTWISAPTTGDTMFVYNPGSTSALSDDSWQGPIPVTAALGVGTCPTSTGFTSTTSEASNSITLTFSTALAANVVPGNVIRFYRHAKYKLFQPVGSSSWYLGYQECPAGLCGTMQPVAGPYLAYSANPGSTGLRFVFRDSTGAVTATTPQVARIDIVAKAQTENPIRMPGRPEDYYSDSLVVTVALRNRS
ncbi:MAG TPA: type II secretion system protein [Gemmatimonadaceae bacterium]|jgi:prepilin-type N-terminal cleavage/methylation domain-containing protein